MKVVVCNDSDAEELIAKMRLKEIEAIQRFTQQQDDRQRFALAETSRGLMYVLISWLQEQGFKIS